MTLERIERYAKEIQDYAEKRGMTETQREVLAFWLEMGMVTDNLDHVIEQKYEEFLDWTRQDKFYVYELN